MEYEDKVMALAKFLQVDPALIENDYGDYYTVNGRTVKEGKTPEQFKKLADDFRSLLDDEMQELVTTAIIDGSKLVEVLKGEEKVKTPLSDHAYAVVNAYLEPMAGKAEKRKEQLARLDMQTWKPPIKETPEDVYNRLKEDSLYVSNILYHLVKEKDSYNREYTEQLRRAWLGQPLSDIRKDRQVDDGEYLVFEDDEADEYEREGLESLFDDTVEIPAHLENYIDKERWIDDNAGERGANIASYDGEENEVEFEGTTYYIYRHN